MAYSKLYTGTRWVNKSEGTTSPINAVNLNKIEYVLDELDNRVMEQETIKLDKATALTMVKDWSMDEETGIITITKLNGEKILFDLNIEKIPVAFAMDEAGVITMTTDDGTEFTADIGSMIPVLMFHDTDTIAVSVTGTGINKTYSFSIKNGSVTEEKLQPNYLADIRVQAAAAETAKDAADTSKTAADASAKSAQSYAVGGTGTRAGEDTDNAKYYAEQAKAASNIDSAIENLKETDLLDTKEEIEANTSSGKFAGALAMKEVFQSVSNGKSLIASAITDKGVDTSADASFATMAQNIGNIERINVYDNVIFYMTSEGHVANIFEILPNYQNYTLADFIIQLKNVIERMGPSSGNVTFTKKNISFSYDAVEGKLKTYFGIAGSDSSKNLYAKIAIKQR